MKAKTLGELARSQPWKGGVSVSVKTGSAPPPRLQTQLQRMEDLGLPLDEAVLSLASLAPIDPFGVFGALRPMGRWVFQADTFSAMCIVDQEGNDIKAAMQIDLITDDMVFLAHNDGKIFVVSRLGGDDIAAWLREPEITEKVIFERIGLLIQQAVIKARVG